MIARTWSSLAAGLSLLAMGAIALTACRTPDQSRAAARALLLGDYVTAKRQIAAGLTSAPHDAGLLALELRVLASQGQRPKMVQSMLARQPDPSDQAVRQAALAVIWGALVHASPQIRIRAVQAARATDARELREIVATRLQDPNPEVRVWASVALSREAAGALTLLELLESPAAEARAVAIEHVARFAGPRSMDPLRHASASTVSSDRVAAARALAFLPPPLRRPLCAKLSGDRDPAVRVALYRALASARGHLATQLSDLGLDPVDRSLAEGRHAEHLAALEWIARANVNRALPRLSRAAGRDEPRIALSAGRLLARSGGPPGPVLGSIASAMRSKQPNLRTLAINTAAILGDPVALGLIEPGLKDSDLDVRLAAARALNEQLPRRSATALTEIASASCSANTAELIALRCIAALSRLGDAEELAARLSTMPAQPRKEGYLSALRLRYDEKLVLRALADSSIAVALGVAEWTYRHLR